VDEMIAVLTRGIGAELGRPIRRNYYSARDALKRSDHYKALNAEQKVFALDLLALTTFHAAVIVPLEGSRRFMAQAAKLGAVRVRMGDYDYDNAQAKLAEGIGKQFFAILKAYMIDTADLYFDSPEGLARRIRGWEASHAGS
jgi:hypothetical protein